MSDTTKAEKRTIPVAVHADRDEARTAERAVRDEIGEVLKRHGVLGAILVLSLVYKTPEGMQVNVSMEGSGNPDEVKSMTKVLLNPAIVGSFS